MATLPAGRAPRVWLVEGPDERRRAIRHNPFRQVVDIAHSASRLGLVGLSKARMIVAATDRDMHNLTLAEAALTERSAAEVLVRIERPVSRALFSDDLRARAGASGVQVLCLSFAQMRQRIALDLAMPGRFVDTRARGHHIVVAGDGPELVEMADLIARQGYGAERTPPRLTVLALDASLALHPTLERLQDARSVVRLRVHHAEAQDREAIDQAILRIMEDGAPITAVHCTGSGHGQAAGLALRWERLFLAGHRIVPPIVALDDVQNPGLSGMIRCAVPPDLSECRAVSARLDLHARAAHEAYIEGRKRARGDEFGSLPAEKEWEDLPERFRDDNRSFADHIGYKLSLVGLVLGPDRDTPSPDPVDYPHLAEVEHARWMAARVVDRWQYGAVRDDANRIHPDIRPFAELDADARQKDADLLSSLLITLRRCGEALYAETGFDLDTEQTPPGDRLARAIRRLRDWQSETPHVAILLCVHLQSWSDVAAANQAMEAGIATEVILSPRIMASTDLTGSEAWRAALNGARRIRVTDTPEPERSRPCLHELEAA